MEIGEDKDRQSDAFIAVEKRVVAAEMEKVRRSLFYRAFMEERAVEAPLRRGNGGVRRH